MMAEGGGGGGAAGAFFCSLENEPGLLGDGKGTGWEKLRWRGLGRGKAAEQAGARSHPAF